MSSANRPTSILRIIFLIGWTVLFVALLQRDYFIKSLELKEAGIIKRDKEESFLGIYLQDERIGFVKNRLVQSSSDGFKLFQDAFLRLNILNESHPVTMQVTADLTATLLLKKFTFRLSSPFYKMKAQGEVNGNDMRFTLTSGKETIEDIVRLKNPPFLSTNQRGYLLTQGLHEGDKIKVPYFDPISLSGKNTVVEYRGLQKILIHGRVYNLHHFIESYSGIRVNSWLDNQGKVIKEESPAGFIFLSEPEFRATSIGAGSKEILSTVSVPVAGVVPDLQRLINMDYRLTLPDEGDFSLNQDRQSFKNGILHITLEDMPEANAPVCSNKEDELVSSPYIQARNESIVQLGESLTQGIPSALAKVRSIADWVFHNLEKRPVLGIPDALTTLRTRRGDCNEHAVLFAALARSVAIPARVVAGVTFHEGAFYYHAWNEVCLDGTWLSLDTTKNQLPADISHIKFVEGEPRDMIKIGALLGKLQIEVLTESDR